MLHEVPDARKGKEHMQASHTLMCFAGVQDLLPVANRHNLMVAAARGDSVQHPAVHRLGTGSCKEDSNELVEEGDVPGADPLQQVAVPAPRALQVAQCRSSLSGLAVG